MSNRPDGLMWLLVAILVVGCGDSPTVDGGIIHTGFEGTWVADVGGSPLTLQIGDFYLGISSEGRVLWGSFNWRLSCGIATAYGPNELSCMVGPNVSGCHSGAGLPYVDIRSADTSGLSALVGGELRTIEDGPSCDGDVIMSWEPSTEVIFRRP